MLDEDCGDFTLIGEFRNMLMFSALLTGLLLLCRQWRPAIFRRRHAAVHRAGQHRHQTVFRPGPPGGADRPTDQLQHAQRPCVGSFALFLVLAVLAGRGQPPRMRLTWLLLGCIPALSIALSRVYLGAHWPTDILAGRCWRHACARGPVAESAQGAAQRHAVQGLVAGLPALVALFAFFVIRHLPHNVAVAYSPA
jgi:undecaprenyl-diphosphatase